EEKLKLDKKDKRIKFLEKKIEKLENERYEKLETENYELKQENEELMKKLLTKGRNKNSNFSSNIILT
ncbi:4948_t:CDS:1, partial [Racocetra fulgida]